MTREVELTKDVDVMDADEAVKNVCCAPCCCGLTLLNFLKPFEVNTVFVPRSIDAKLEVAGQGVRLNVRPTECEAYVDGKLCTPLEGGYFLMSPGDHELEVKADGFRNYQRAVHVDVRVYQQVDIDLPIEGQGLLLVGTPDGARVYVDDQYKGNLGGDARRIRTEPGPHLVRVELEGWRGWQDIVQTVADRYQELTIALPLEGQGIRIKKPEGVPAKSLQLQVIVDGQLQGSEFDAPIRIAPGDHQIEIRVTTRETRLVSVHVAENAFLDLEPGPRRDGNTDRPQTTLDRQGIRVIEPVDFKGDPNPEQIQITVDGALRAQGFGQFVDLGEGDHALTVTVVGYKSWSQTIHVSKKRTLDVFPLLMKE